MTVHIPGFHFASFVACLIGINAAVGGDIRFTDVTEKSGIDFKMTCGRMPAREILEVDGGGVALFDFDNDGDLDVFLANGATMDDPEYGPGSRLYANRGNGTFDDVTERLGIHVKRWAMGVAVGDYNGDGWDDMYVTCYGPDILLRNNCGDKSNPRFIDATADSGIRDNFWGTSAAFGDVDGDGDLDLYVVNYLKFDVKNPPDRAGKTFKGVPVMAGPAGLEAEPDILYENIGDGGFRDITRQAGIIENPPGYGLGVRMFDFDGDGFLDIFVGNDSSGNYLFRNLGRNKALQPPKTVTPKFENIAVAAGVFANLEGTTQASMGIALADIDSNGHPDLFTTNFSSDTNTLFLNLGDGFFDDRTAQFGLGLVSRPYLSWGCGFFDFDLDGDEDLLIASGHVYPETAENKMDTEYAQELLLFERDGKRFVKTTDSNAVFAKKYHARAMAFGDIDNDGDVDAIMTTLNGPVHVLRNESNQRNWIKVNLRGPKGNPRGYGAKVELVSPRANQRRWITGGGSFQSVDAPTAYFGIGEAEVEKELSVRVIFADGKTSEQRIDRPNQNVIMEYKGAAAGK